MNLVTVEGVRITPVLIVGSMAPSGFAVGQAAIDDDPAVLIVDARDGRQSVSIMNTGADAVVIGGDDVTASTGFLLPGGATKDFPTSAALYGICAAADSTTVSFIEVF